MISIDGYKDLNLSEYSIPSIVDEKNFNQIIISPENIIVIKEFSNQREVEENWEDVMYFVAGHIQSKISRSKLDESYMWNIYIVYLTKNKIDLELKLNIEKNKFCCKKYLIDWSTYESQTDALINELPILANIDFEVKNDIFLKEGNEIKKLICGNEVNPITKYFIETDNILAMNINMLVEKMMEVYYECSKEN
jgi:hypothetical protein